jgi:hypothetical protein
MVTLDEIPMDAALPLLAPLAGAKADTAMGAMTLPEILNESQTYLVNLDGRDVGAIALKISQHSQGDVLWIVGGVGGCKGADMVRDVLPAVEEAAEINRCQFTAITTRRPGMVKKLEAVGYEVTGITLRKRISK